MCNVFFLVVRGGMCRFSFARNDASSSKDVAKSGKSLPLYAYLCIPTNKEASAAFSAATFGSQHCKKEEDDDTTK